MTAIAEFRELWSARDLDSWVGTLTEDVVLHSPLLTKEIHGRSAARLLYAELLSVLPDLHVLREWEDSGGGCAWWRASVRGQPVEGVDLLTYGKDGRVEAVHVFIRPLRGLAAFASASGPPVAGLRSKRAQVVAKPLMQLLPLVARATDTIAPALLPKAWTRSGRR